MPSLPLIVYGTITESGSPIASVLVKLRNDRTLNSTSTTTNASGLYVLDAANITGGYLDGDDLTVYTIYTNLEGEETITIDLDENYLYEQDVALTEVYDSSSIDYCTVQDVYDELDGKTSSDISSDKIVLSVQRAEALVDLRTGTSFKINTQTDEVHSMNRYNTDVSPEKRDSGYGWPQRVDRWGFINNRVQIDRTPIISITSLSRNDASSASADSWTELDEQSGSGGDFLIVNKDVGTIDFVSNYPKFGERSWKSTYTWGHDPESSDRDIIARVRAVQRITILLASKSILSRKSSGSIFDSTRDIKIGTIEIKGAGTSTSTHISDITTELDGLWNAIGDLGLEVI